MINVDKEIERGTEMIDTEAASRIFTAMIELQGQFIEWQTMGAIRETVQGSMTRDEFDVLMIQMMELRIIDMIPEDNQKTINGPDDMNAVRHPAGIVWHLARIA